MSDVVDKAALLFSCTIPKGTAVLNGTEVPVRGMSAGEEVSFAGDEGYAENILLICQACILDSAGDPLFTHAEIGSMRSGIFSAVFVKILELSFPKKKAIRKKS